MYNGEGRRTLAAPSESSQREQGLRWRAEASGGKEGCGGCNAESDGGGGEKTQGQSEERGTGSGWWVRGRTHL